MQQQRRLRYLALSTIFICLIWGCSAAEEDIRAPDSSERGNTYSSESERFDSAVTEEGIAQPSLDRIRAEDLSLTTSLFIQQLSAQLKRWAELDFEDPELDPKFEQEISDHPHFHSFALVKDGSVQLKKGNFPAEKLESLNLGEGIDDQTIFSDPYTRHDKHYLLVAHPQGDQEYVVGEVDLSFIQTVIGDMAAVADANGNFFMSGDETKIHWEKGKANQMELSEAEVPELKWTIAVHSEQPDAASKDEHYREGEVLIRFESEQAGLAWLEQHPDYEAKKHFDAYFMVGHEQLTTKQMLNTLSQETEIISVEPNYLFEKQQDGVIPNDEFFELYQSNLSQISADQGWQISAGSEDVIIAVIDTGVDPDHVDLAGKLTDGYNAFTDTDDYADEHGHGTHVAGIAAAMTNNVSGIAGVSWHAPIMPVKALDEQGEGSLFEITNAIIWATDHGAKVINLSLGDDQPSDMLYEAIRYAYERDVVLIAASGNENVDTPMYPAAYDEVFAISAVDAQLEKAVFSNYGPYIDVAAPGQNIPSTFLNDQYVFMSGTSMAAPHVTGLAALIRAFRPELTNEEVMQLMRETADDLGEAGYDSYFGYGQINVFKALQFLEENDSRVLSQLVEDRLSGASEENWLEQDSLPDKDSGHWLQEWLQQVMEQWVNR